MLTARIVRPDALTSNDLATWASFREGRPEFCNPLFGPSWAQAVGRVRPDAHVAVLKRDGRTVGFLAHNRDSSGMGRPIGAPFSDLHALVAEPGCDVSLREAVTAAGLSAYRFTGLVDPEHRVKGVQDRTPAYVVIQNGADDLLELFRQRNAKRFKNWRRLGNKLDRDHAPSRLVAHDESLAAYHQLLQWKREQLRRSGLHDVYGPSWVRTLMAGLQASPGPAFGGLLVMLYAGDRPVAGEFGVREGGCFHPWIAAYDPAFSAYSPGILLQFRIIEQMSALGLRRYDLGAQADHYKAPMATHQFDVSSGVTWAAEHRPGGLSNALRRSPLGARVSQRWEQIAAVETTALGRMQGVVTAVCDGPRRLGGQQLG